METNSKQIITLTDGKILTMGGVVDIAGFEDGMIVLDTTRGRINIEGADLKIESLNSDGGNILIKGQITGFFCSEERADKKSFLRKIFG